MLSDKSGEISGKKWDVAEEIETLKDISEGDIIKVRANIIEWNGAKQMKITKIRKIHTKR